MQGALLKVLNNLWGVNNGYMYMYNWSTSKHDTNTTLYINSTPIKIFKKKKIHESKQLFKNMLMHHNSNRGFDISETSVRPGRQVRTLFLT